MTKFVNVLPPGASSQRSLTTEYRPLITERAPAVPCQPAVPCRAMCQLRGAPLVRPAEQRPVRPTPVTDSHVCASTAHGFTAPVCERLPLHARHCGPTFAALLPAAAGTAGGASWDGLAGRAGTSWRGELGWWGAAPDSATASSFPAGTRVCHVTQTSTHHCTALPAPRAV